MKRLYGNLVILASLYGQKRAAFLPRHRLEAVRDARVRRIVQHAARSVPHYRELFAKQGIDPATIRGAADLAALPLLERGAVKRDPERFLSDSRRARGALSFVTSGSTGSPLEVQHDRRSLLQNIAFGERERAPLITLCGGSFRPRELHIGYATSNLRKVLEFYARSTRLPIKPDRTSLSMTAPFEEILAAINTVKPELLTAYGGFLDAFFRNLEARGASLHVPKVIQYVGEPLPPGRRAWIEQKLGARVMSRYCAAEAFKIGYFCEAGTGFHLHDDLCHVRLLTPAGQEAEAGAPGEVVISNLVNYATVLLNYPMGDVATLSDQNCPCGRTQRLLSELEGRVEDMLALPGGEHLHPRAIWAVFKDDREVLQYQLVQAELQRFELKLVTAEQAFARASERAVAGLRRLLGESVAIEASWHAQLGQREREKTGKFRAVESRLKPRPA